eukprot:TRINITY_DN698_c0_g1_i1.p1 TRINITY_DN698_c0_g1~~TRINITY_DN698_c0_g1_i1.p1  ORF type:complete len:714 (-),score=168.81 TRINITY_DN698_c0_g1_i1:77-2107(-)
MLLEVLHADYVEAGQTLEAEVARKPHRNESECERAVRGMYKLQTPHGFEMLDYCGRSINDEGKYSNCMSLNRPHNRNHAHYAIAEFKLIMLKNVSTPNYTGPVDLPLNLRWGLCLPMNCTNDDIPTVFPIVLSLLGETKLVNRVEKISGHFSDDIKWKGWTGGAIFTVFLLCFLAFLAVVSTFVMRGYYWWLEKKKQQALDEGSDVFSIQNDGDNTLAAKSKPAALPLWAKFVNCFCITRNTNSLLAPVASDDFISALDGMRFISMCWVLLGHTLMFGFGVGGFGNAVYILRNVIKRWTFMLIWNADFSVDSFFFMSGLVVAWKLYPCLCKSRPTPISAVLYVVLRYIRLTALLSMCLLLDIFIIPLIVDGPFTYNYKYYDDPCRSKWWVVLLYMQNLYPNPNASTQCYSVAWYIANDTQFYLVLAPILVFVTAWSWKVGWPFMFTVLCTSFITTSAIVATNPTSINADTTTRDTYMVPWTRWQPYVIGLMFAILLRQLGPYKKTIERKWQWWVSGICFAVGGGLLLLLEWGNYGEKSKGVEWNKTQTVLWGGFTRGAWATGLALIITPCYFGHGGMISDLLGHRVFGPLSKLTYATYLLHPLWVSYTAHSRWHPYVYNDVDTVTNFFGTVAVAHVMSFTSWIILEKPVANLLAISTSTLMQLARRGSGDSQRGGV